MQEQNLYERVKEPDDPRRCQATIASQGQCWLVKMDGTDYCIAHGGAAAAKRNAEEGKRIYRAAKWRARIGEQADHDRIKSLREEIGILRMMIDERLEFCKSQTDLILSSGPLSDLIMKVEKLVTSCDKMDTKLGKTLDESQALQFGQEIVEIVSNNLEDIPNRDEILEAVSNEIAQAITRLSKTG